MLDVSKNDGRSAVQKLIDSILGLLLSKQLRPGDRLPSEYELAEAFGVSRSTVREAVKILTYQGILVIHRGDGTFVCDHFSPLMINPMIYGLFFHRESSIASLWELREILEVGITKLAALNRTNEELERLERAMVGFENVCKSSSDVDEIVTADNRFHEVVSDMAHNEMVSYMYNVMLLIIDSQRRLTIRKAIETKNLEYGLKGHRKIYGLIENQRTDELMSVIPESFFWERS